MSAKAGMFTGALLMVASSNPSRGGGMSQGLAVSMPASHGREARA